MKMRALLMLLALPLVAFDCGGKDQELERSPFGLACRLHVGGAVPVEDLWCIVTAHDYAQDPYPYASNTWVFELVAYRSNLMEVGAGAGVFLDGRPALGTPYGWDGNFASSLLASGGAERYGGSLLAQPPTYVETHSAFSLGDWGAGTLSVTFTEIPLASAVGEQSLRVHGSLTATLPSDTTGNPATLSATF